MAADEKKEREDRVESRYSGGPRDDRCRIRTRCRLYEKRTDLRHRACDPFRRGMHRISDDLLKRYDGSSLYEQRRRNPY